MISEYDFERKLIAFLSKGRVPIELEDGTEVFDFYTAQLWSYREDLKTEEDLWENFRQHLRRLNPSLLHQDLSDTEFGQIKNEIEKLDTPYEAGKFLYGLNGVSQVGVEMDDGRHLILTVFDQRNIGAGNSVYELVNQVRRKARIQGKPNRVFDVTLLINGLPIIQIELKREHKSVEEALNQMHQYALEGQYRGIFSLVQILIAMTPNNAKYMANTTAERFNKDFAFNWQDRETSDKIRNWKEFANRMLSIPMAHKMATNFMILDGTPNKQSLKVMRPYQVYATEAVLQSIIDHEFELGEKRLGYVWHTTGSGKTITSFKTAWLASRLPKVEKVVFVVDRIALTKQTFENYKAYDPNAEGTGCVEDTENTYDLRQKLKDNSNNIIVTSVQKLLKLVESKHYTPPKKRIVFIVDEAHRSTAGDGFKRIQRAFRQGAWVGYTGTPQFEGITTQDIFGQMLHAYTIKEAISDANVLGFHVEFKSTVDLRALVRNKYPHFNEEDIDQELENMRKQEFEQADLFERGEDGKKTTKGEAIEGSLEPNFYDVTLGHVEAVVNDIFTYWRNRSNDYRYNALLTTHVSGRGASTPLALRYFDEFVRVNKERKFRQGERPLKVAITYSVNTTNSNSMVQVNSGLSKAIEHYNQLFGTEFDMTTVAEYTQDVMQRLNKTCFDKQYLDLVIVVDQLLTGFDAPELNTLYVDRILQGSSLIQAYSRTNRIIDMSNKPFGRIVNYRWPAQNERLMNTALATYSNRAVSIDDPEKEDKEKSGNYKEGILAKPIPERIKNLIRLKEEIARLTCNSKGEPYTQCPRDEIEQDLLLSYVREYNREQIACKQYCSEMNLQGKEFEGYDYNDPDHFLRLYDMNPTDEAQLQVVVTTLRQNIARRKKIQFSEVEITMSHVKEVEVNYNYLTKLLEQLVNQVQENNVEEAKQTVVEVNKFADGLEDMVYADKIRFTAEAVMEKKYPDKDYGGKFNISEAGGLNQMIQSASTYIVNLKIQAFIEKMGLQNSATVTIIRQIFTNHHKGNYRGLNSDNKVAELLTDGSANYNKLSTDPEIVALSRIKYRNLFITNLREFADSIVEYI